MEGPHQRALPLPCRPAPVGLQPWPFLAKWRRVLPLRFREAEVEVFARRMGCGLHARWGAEWHPARVALLHFCLWASAHCSTRGRPGLRAPLCLRLVSGRVNPLSHPQMTLEVSSSTFLVHASPVNVLPPFLFWLSHLEEVHPGKHVFFHFCRQRPVLGLPISTRALSLFFQNEGLPMRCLAAASQPLTCETWMQQSGTRSTTRGW